jgi:predicted DNA-binding transcriptional regulator YafY
MRINRLFEIVYLLMNKKRMTTTELASHFEVSKRTILRDIDALSTAGIPIYTLQGKGGGVFIYDKFLLNKTFLSEEEQKQILFSLQSTSATEFIENEKLLGRLRSLFDNYNKEWFEVDFSRWGHSQIDSVKFESLKSAIISERAISFDYLNVYGQSESYEVYPLKLSFKSKSWYLKSFCKSENDFRVFKFTRMNAIKILEKSFISKDYEGKMNEPIDNQASINLVEVKLQVSPNAKYRIYDEFSESDILIDEDGSFTLRMTKGQWIYDYLLSYGVHIKVLEPVHIRDELLNRIDKIKNHYLSKP